MKTFIKNIIGSKALSAYHLLKAQVAALINGYPSEKLIVIGITGTKGKSTTANLVWAGLMGAGIKTGLTGTANIKIGDQESMNTFHMTMPSPFAIQGTFKKMVKAGCRAVILETTSQGIIQSRHKGINYDILIFTNLTPEHIDSHKTFDNYRAAKQVIFKELASHKKKNLAGFGTVPKVIIVNNDSPEAPEFAKFDADKKISFGIDTPSTLQAKNVSESETGVSFEVDGRKVDLKTLGAFNVLNALPAIGIARILNLDEAATIKGLESLELIPGRMEIMQKQPYWVIVDYAHEKISMTKALESCRKIAGADNKVIVLLGAEGGGRDKLKRAHLGNISAQLADYVVVSNVDPYDDEPKQIVDDIANIAAQNGKKDGLDLFRIEDRRAGIRKCLELAKEGDVVIITGKGAEQSMIIGGKNVPWDDRQVTREEISNVLTKGV